MARLRRNTFRAAVQPVNGMKMKYVLFAAIFLISSLATADMVAYSTMKQIMESSYQRYILVKGASLKSPLQKLRDHGTLASPRPSIQYDFEVAEVDSWFVFKLPHETSHWMHHNIAYWFLGWGADDPNYADSVIGLAINTNGRNYVVYGSNDASRPEDSLYGRTSLGSQFVIDISFDQLAVQHKNEIPSVPGIVGNFNLPDGLKFSTVSVEYHEALEQTIH